MIAATLPAATPAALRRQARLARIMRAIRAAQAANPRNAGLYAGSVTITDNGATVPAQIAAPIYPCNQTSQSVWHVVGGRHVDGSGMLKAGTVDGGGGALRNHSRYRVMAHARYVALRLNATALPVRILVDGRYVSAAGTTLATTSGSANQYLLLDFGTRAVRQVTVELMQTAGLAGAYTEATGKLWPVSLGDAVHGAMLGDSYVYGSGPALVADGVAPQLGDWLGIHLHASGSGGTGWNQTNQAVYRFDQRIANGDLALGYNPPDILFLMASYNDRNSDAATVTANALAGLRSARAQHSELPIVVFGACPGATGPSTGAPSIVQTETAVQAAVTALADPYVAFVPVSTDPLGAWITGTGRVGTTTGSGNSDWATSADAVHPSDEGAALIGRRYADGAARALRAMLG